MSSLLRAQEAALQSEGFVVKNCFIDESPSQKSEGSRTRRHSAPPSPTRFMFIRHPESPFGSLVPRQKSDGADDSDFDDDASTERNSPCRLSGWDGDKSSNSADVSDNDDETSTQASCTPGRNRCPSSADSACAEDGAIEPIHGPDAAEAACEELRLAILDKCGFLRLVDSSYRPFPNRGKSDCSGSLMFYVAGLPWARRARWVVPLRLGVSKVLESCGYRTQMSVGVLYVSDPEGSYRVRISFAPSLASAR